MPALHPYLIKTYKPEAFTCPACLAEVSPEADEGGPNHMIVIISFLLALNQKNACGGEKDEWMLLWLLRAKRASRPLSLPALARHSTCVFFVLRTMIGSTHKPLGQP